MRRARLQEADAGTPADVDVADEAQDEERHGQTPQARLHQALGLSVVLYLGLSSTCVSDSQRNDPWLEHRDGAWWGAHMEADAEIRHPIMGEDKLELG